MSFLRPDRFETGRLYVLDRGLCRFSHACPTSTKQGIFGDASQEQHRLERFGVVGRQENRPALRQVIPAAHTGKGKLDYRSDSSNQLVRYREWQEGRFLSKTSTAAV